MTKMSPFESRSFRKQTGLNPKSLAQTPITDKNLPLLWIREEGLTIGEFENSRKTRLLSGVSRNNLRAHRLFALTSCLRDLEAFWLSSLSRRIYWPKTRLIVPTCGNGKHFGFSISLINLTNNYQTCLQLSGQGCKEMELLLEHKDFLANFLQNILYAYEDVQSKNIAISP